MHVHVTDINLYPALERAVEIFKFLNLVGTDEVRDACAFERVLDGDQLFPCIADTKRLEIETGWIELIDWSHLHFFFGRRRSLVVNFDVELRRLISAERTSRAVSVRS